MAYRSYETHGHCSPQALCAPPTALHTEAGSTVIQTEGSCQGSAADSHGLGGSPQDIGLTSNSTLLLSHGKLSSIIGLQGHWL